MFGSGTCTPHPSRQTAAYGVEVQGHRWLMDSGTGTIQRLVHQGWSPFDLDGLFYTHLHLDHTGDLFPLLFLLRNSEGQHRTRTLPIYGPPGFAAFFQALMGVYGRWVRTPEYDITLHELGGEVRRVDLGPVVVDTFRVRHSNTAVGYRWTEMEAGGGRSLAFSGDAGEGAELVDLFSGVDVAVVECSSPDDHPIPGHLTPSRVSVLVNQAKPKQVVLTHFYPPLANDPGPAVEQVSTQTGCPTFAAYDGMVVDVGVDLPVENFR